MDSPDVMDPEASAHQVPLARAQARLVADVAERLERLQHAADYTAIEQLAATTRAMADRDGDNALVAMALECEGHAAWNAARYPDGLRHFGDAAQRWQDEGDRQGEARVRLWYAQTLSICGLTTEALEQAYTALDLIDETTTAAVHVGTLYAILRVHTMLRAWPEAGQFAARALAVARAYDDPNEIGKAMSASSYVTCERCREAREIGDLPTLESLAAEGEIANREAHRFCKAVGLPVRAWVTGLNLAECLMDLGRLDEAAGLTEQIHRELEQADPPSPYLHAEAFVTRAQIHFASDRHAQGVDDLEHVLAMAKHHTMNELVMKSHELLTNACEAKGDDRQALVHHRAFFEVHKQILSEAARLRSAVVAVQLQTAEARAAAVTHQKRAEDLETSNRELARESMEDPLTGLANRRSFTRAFDRLAAQHAGDGEPYFLAILDVDDFKRVNDRFSHAIGDDVLRAIASLIRTECRPTDTGSRYGGEEFAVLISPATIDEAIDRCERICRAIEHSDWPSIAAGLRVTTSIGLADSRECTDRASMFELADRRLYAAKKSGKNRVVASAR